MSTEKVAYTLKKCDIEYQIILTDLSWFEIYSLNLSSYSMYHISMGHKYSHGTCPERIDWHPSLASKGIHIPKKRVR